MTVTIERLEQYSDLRKEVALLGSRLAGMDEYISTPVMDKVKASLPVFPYTEYSATVKGCADKHNAKYARVRRLYESRSAQLQAELQAIEAWIAGITDSKVRQIVEYKYVLGHTWSATARRAYGHPCESTARMRLERYLKNNL